MTTTLPPAARYAPAPPASMPLRRFTVDEYHRMIEDGYFAADERFELLEGLIVEKMSKNPPHESLVARARRVLDRRLPPGWHVRVQSTVTTPDSEPEPDLAIVPGDELDYFHRHPGASDTALVVEVADSTLRDDQTIKYRVYARAGFTPYWILNVPGRRLHVYEQPSGDVAAPSYLREAEYGPGQAVTLVVGGTQIGPVPVDELLP